MRIVRVITGRRYVVALATLFAVSLAACGGDTASRTVAPPLSGQAALDAQATLAVWSAMSTAQAEETRRVERATAEAAESNAQATRSAESATAQAVQAAGATAAAHGTAVALEATATAGAQLAAATAQAAQATATWDALLARQQAMAMEATATADAAALRFQEEQAAKALAARQAEIERAELWTRMTPWIVGAAVVTLLTLLVIFALTLAVERMRRTRPVRAGDVWVMVGPGGPTVLNRPPALLPPPRVQQPRVTISTPAAEQAPVPLPEVRYGHVLIAGETGSGKSTAMRAVLRPRAGVTVLDPHSAGGDWGAAQVIGAGRDFEAIREYMDGMGRLLSERYAERAGGRQAFDPITVAVDEMPAIVGEVGRDIEVIWRQWLREGRKVSLFLVLSTQSTRVRTLGIEGERDLLDNFTFVLALGDVARREYPAVVGEMARPAALVTRGRARPVIIPEVENVVRLGPTRPQYIAPVPLPKADPRRMTEADVARIRDLLAGGWSQRAVEEELFGYTGGAAWRAVMAVMNGQEAVDLPPAHYEA